MGVAKQLVSDELWATVEPLLPPTRAPGTRGTRRCPTGWLWRGSYRRRLLLGGDQVLADGHLSVVRHLGQARSPRAERPRRRRRTRDGWHGHCCPGRVVEGQRECRFLPGLLSASLPGGSPA